MQWKCTTRRHNRSFGVTWKRNSIHFCSFSGLEFHSISYRHVTELWYILWTFEGLSYPREVIGNVWKFLTSPIEKWRKINCGFKKSISANHCNKSRFSFELQNSFVVVVQTIKNCDEWNPISGFDVGIYFRINGYIQTEAFAWKHVKDKSINKWIFTLSVAYAAVFSRKLKIERFTRDTSSPANLKLKWNLIRAQL